MHKRRIVTSPVIAHRGASAYAPENTIASLRRAAELGARWVEVDVTLTSDGGLVLLHDETVDRTTDGAGAVFDRTLAEVRSLDAGCWFGPAFLGERIPTLDETVQVCLDLGLNLQLELKPHRGNDRELAQRALDRFATLWPETLHGNVFIASFSSVCLQLARTLLPSVAQAIAVREIPRDPHRILRAADADILHVVDAGFALDDYRRLGDTGIEYAVAIVNDPVRARDLLEVGCQTVLTDKPDLLAG